MKVLFGMALRQTTGFVARLLKLIGLDWAVPDFSTLCRPLPGQTEGRACLHAGEGPIAVPTLSSLWARFCWRNAASSYHTRQSAGGALNLAICLQAISAEDCLTGSMKMAPRRGCDYEARKETLAVVGGRSGRVCP